MEYLVPLCLTALALKLCRKTSYGHADPWFIEREMKEGMYNLDWAKRVIRNGRDLCERPLPPRPIPPTSAKRQERRWRRYAELAFDHYFVLNECFKGLEDTVYNISCIAFSLSVIQQFPDETLIELDELLTRAREKLLECRLRITDDLDAFRKSGLVLQSIPYDEDTKYMGYYERFVCGPSIQSP